MLKKIVFAIFALLLSLFGVLIFNAVTFKSKQKNYPAVNKLEISDSVVKNLSDAIRIKTISYDDTSRIDYSSFSRFHAFLDERYPLIDSVLKKEKINQYSLLYIWEGKNKDLNPTMFTGHIDIVPVEKASIDKWKHHPYSGKIVDNFIWGRGSLDDKGAVLGLLEAATNLIKSGYQPERTVMFGFGHDEEATGKLGAKKIVEYMQLNNIKAEFVMDEGLPITKGIVPGIKKQVALIGTSEKGYLTLELSIDIKGGHSSMPANETAIGVLSKAISTLRANPFPAEFNKSVSAFGETAGPEMPFGLKLAFANRWLLEQQIIDAYSATPSGKALLTTTIAPTIFRAGEKENAIPAIAKATINFRTLPGTTIDEVITYVKRTINDKRIIITKKGIPNEASPVSSHTALGFRMIEKAIREVDSNTIVTPNLMIATTDGRHYPSVAENVYRFLPVTFTREDLPRIHGTNERISIENYKQSIRFYIQLIKNASKETL